MSMLFRNIGYEQKSSILPYAALLITMVMFGSAFASSKFVVAELPFEVAAALRFSGGSILLVLLSFCSPKKEPIPITTGVKFGLIGLIGVFAYNIFFFWALALAPSIDGSIIVPVLSPIITIIILFLLGKQKISFLKANGFLLGVIGASVFLFSVKHGASDAKRIYGDIIFVIGASCWAAYSIISKGLFTKYKIEPLQATSWSTVFGSLALLTFCFPKLIEVEWHSISHLAWINLAYLSIGPTAIAYLFYYYALRTVSASTATVMMFTVPFFGTFFSNIFLGESLSFFQVVGGAIMLIGAVMVIGVVNISKKD